MQGQNVIFMRGLWPHLPVAERVSASSGRLFAFGVVPLMDKREEDYRFCVEVHTADPEAEQAIAGMCSRAVNSMPRVLDAMQYAWQKLDSVPYLEKPGDTNVAKQSLRGAIDALTGDEDGWDGYSGPSGTDDPLVGALELNDVMCLIGHAKALQLNGETEMPAFLLRLARKLAVAMDDDDVAERVRQLQQGASSVKVEAG